LAAEKALIDTSRPVSSLVPLPREPFRGYSTPPLDGPILCRWPAFASSWANEAQAAKNNFGFERTEIMPGNVGHLKLSEINFFYQGSITALQAAATFLKHTDALIIDLRDNGGGGDDIGPVFVSWFLKKETPLLGFKTATTKTLTYGQTMNILPVERRLDTPLYILINRRTGSASEAYAYMLQNHKRATIVGEPSAGAANASEEYALTPFLRMSVSKAAPVSFVTHTNWEYVGVQPDLPCDPAQALTEAHRSALRQLSGANPELRPLLQTLKAPTKTN
jgi:C-terminal processing protease CtpA/Prc